MKDAIMSEDLLRELSIGRGSTSMITVMGVGGAGGNAVNHMYNKGITGVNFLVCNTDQQALDISPVENKLRLGREGIGAGDDPERGHSAAVESLEEVRCRLESLNTSMLFITAGMGGGTGTGASPVLAKLAKEMGILTVGIVSSPFKLEGLPRYTKAQTGIKNLSDEVDSLLILNNENILSLYGNLSLKKAFSKADSILSSTAKGIAEIITVKSDLVNVDFADVCKVMRQSGRAHMSVVSSEGDSRAEEVAKNALNSPLLDSQKIVGAKNILLNFSVSDNEKLQLCEITSVMQHIQDSVKTINEKGEEVSANIIWGTSVKPELEDSLELVLVATGLSDSAVDDTQIEPQNQQTMRQGNVQESWDSFKSDLDNYGKSQLSGVTPSTLTGGNNFQVVLGEGRSKYADIDEILALPAYKSRNAQFITEAPAGRCVVLKTDKGVKPSQTEDKNLLFPKID